MSKINLENEKLKQKFFEYQKNAKGLSDATIQSNKNAMYIFDEFMNNKNYSTFTKNVAMDYKKYLENRINKRTGEKLSWGTINKYLMSLRDFFIWLSQQKGYRNKIITSDIQYLNIERGKKRIATTENDVFFPSMDTIITVIKNIKITNDRNLRDRAFLSFLILSGMRISAIRTLPIKAFDENTCQIFQDPKIGVKTKFSKKIFTVLVNFDNEIKQYFLDWVTYLKKEKCFKGTDPMFPKVKLQYNKENKSFDSVSVVPEFLKSSSRFDTIIKEHFRNSGYVEYCTKAIRHLAMYTATGKCKNGKELKAISQNYGHENIYTTLCCYGRLSNEEVYETISKMDFTKNVSDTDNLMYKIMKMFEEENSKRF